MNMSNIKSSCPPDGQRGLLTVLIEGNMLIKYVGVIMLMPHICKPRGKRKYRSTDITKIVIPIFATYLKDTYKILANS